MHQFQSIAWYRPESYSAFQQRPVYAAIRARAHLKRRAAGERHRCSHRAPTFKSLRPEWIGGRSTGLMHLILQAHVRQSRWIVVGRVAGALPADVRKTCFVRIVDNARERQHPACHWLPTAWANSRLPPLSRREDLLDAHTSRGEVQRTWVAAATLEQLGDAFGA